ncbi:hypothetical protein BD324DRAFT_653283 [Kockovaella imperatae]|uniref:Uncharacterized protein n=1 Tax=Kockovaella imperatae TaxID=4999 RepID=A0A1Y1U8Y6_9TREE|nr:hypothetical protein BD324DRAFT_653283 [Kockovaella imperatae]ORX34509.1 hypothetical protein BD324DRAFT_653283 [Kockovaella imperatae]
MSASGLNIVHNSHPLVDMESNDPLGPLGPSSRLALRRATLADDPSARRGSARARLARPETSDSTRSNGSGPSALDTTKEDEAMLKWRKWIVEQSNQESTPKKKPIPLVSLKHGSSSEYTPSLSPLPTPDVDFYTTESVRALRDVELAVDHSKVRPLASANPFSDITSRLGSRRIRPLVLELVQALGHYVDALWFVLYPDRPCPWIQTSRTIQAVQEGKKLGYVNVPTGDDVVFWGNEVEHAIREVDEAVGIYKGVGWAFRSAMEEGGYGNVTVGDPNSDVMRLLKDLEDTLWGEALPRPTDLSYEIPYDFDPYASYAVPPAVVMVAAPSRGYHVIDLGEFAGGDEEVSLAEIGRRRHAAWLKAKAERARVIEPSATDV